MSYGPVRLNLDDDETVYQCYFCTTQLPEIGMNENGDVIVAKGIVFYRIKDRATAEIWSTVSVCELCWRVAEEVRGWYE